MSSVLLQKALASAWKPPEKLLPSEWAERYFVLPREGNAEPGKFHFSRTPYLIGIVDAVVEPGVEDIIFVKPTRVGGTTAGQIDLGYWIDVDPGDCLTVMPTEPAAEEEIEKRVQPILESTPRLKAHKSPRPHDNTLSEIKLDTMSLYTAWSGSPQSLGSKTCRYVRFDEVDKFVPFAGRESDPISLGKERTGTFRHRKRHYITSTPTTREGAIWKQWEGCGDRRHFEVPCPFCGKYQRLVWPQIKWPKLDLADKIKRADEIEIRKLVHYECLHCKAEIKEHHKPKMMDIAAATAHKGWVSEGQTVEPDGTLIGIRPRSKRVGFHLSSLYSPWRTWHEMAAEFIRAEGDLAASMTFRNSRLGEPFEIQIGKMEASIVRSKAAKGPAPKVVPAWAKIVICTVDTQKDHFYYVVRAWGYQYRSQRIDAGICSTFEELKAWALDKEYPLEGSKDLCPVSLQLIDSGGGRNADTGATRTNEVYQYAISDPARIKPIKGSSRELRWPIDKSEQKEHGLILWIIDTFHCKNLLSRLVNDSDTTRWGVDAAADDTYCTQMASEHLVIDPKTKKQEWKPKSSGAPNHYWDCEVYQCAAAIDCALGGDEPGEEPEQAKQAGEDENRWPLRPWERR